MDGTTTIQSVKDRCRAFCTARDWEKFHTPKELAIGLVTESAELLQLFRFKSDEEARALVKDPKRKEAVAHEAADALYFLLRLCEVMEIDVSEALAGKLAVNETKYPVEKVKGKNLRHTEL